MTEITVKPFNWNDNFSKEALEDFENIQKDLPYCTCQNIGMALAKLELMEKLGCQVANTSISREEYKRMSYKENIRAILECYFAGYKEEIIESACNRILELGPKIGHWIKSNIPNEDYVCSECGGACWYYDYQAHVARSEFCPNCGAKMIDPQERSEEE